MLSYDSISDGYMRNNERSCSARLIDTIDLEVKPVKVAKKKKGTILSRKNKDKQTPTQENGENSMEIALETSKRKESIEISTREPPTSPETTISPQNEENSPRGQHKEGFLERLLKRTQSQKNNKKGAISDSHSHSLPQLHVDSNLKDNAPLHAIRRTRSATACAYPNCKKNGGYLKCVKHCTTCFRVAYCSEYCKIEHWPSHKVDCKELPAPSLI